MELQGNQVLTILLFIIIVYVCYTFYNRDDTFMTVMLGVLGAAFMGLLYCSSGFWPEQAKKPGNTTDSTSEHLRDYNALDREVHSSFDNISHSQDAAYLHQHDRDVDVGSAAGTAFDNSDIVERVLSTGTSTYMPLESSSSSIYDVHDRVFNKSGDESNYSEYRVPMHERAMDMDDKLSRKQQHRSSMNERAINGAVRATRNQFQKYFTAELDQNEGHEWWGEDDGNNDLETDFLTSN